MRHLVLFIAPLLDVDEDSPVIFTRHNTDACASELGTDLIKTPSRNTTVGTFDVESGHWRMVRRLFGQVAYIGQFSTATIINRSVPILAVWTGGNRYSRCAVLDFPFALDIPKTKGVSHTYTRAHIHIFGSPGRTRPA